MIPSPSPSTTDLCDERADARVLALVLQDFGGLRQFNGRALTVKCFEDNSKIKELSATPGQGRVMVIDGGGSLRCALVGDVIAADLLKNGWRGVVVDGCIRDRVVLAGLELGVKALGSNPRRPERRGEGQVGEPINIGGTLVHTGDLVYCDDDGVVILPAGT